MLKAIHRAPCSAALAACQHLMRVFTLWLCAPGVSAHDITEANCQAQMPSSIEADWLWALLQRKEAKQPLIDRARRVADMQVALKQDLSTWVQAVAGVPLHFQPPSQPCLPTAQPILIARWLDFKALMLAFYGKGLHQIGLPYLADGTPTDNKSQWLTYLQFRDGFIQANKANPDPDARNVCVLCGGPLTQAAVDHWIGKAAYPLLAVCADNLLPVCGECNEAPNKGEKDIHTGGDFEDWFHPYLRHPNGDIEIHYDVKSLSVLARAYTAANQAKVANVDKLLNLGKRWTLEFKAEYVKQQDLLVRRELRRRKQGEMPHTQAEIQNHIQTTKADLSPTEPHHEVHRTLLAAMLEKARLDAWRDELLLLE